MVKALQNLENRELHIEDLKNLQRNTLKFSADYI
jgi:hypothetical protein